MIRQGKYKDRPAVIVQSASLRAIFLPLDGAKLASLTDLKDGKELLATKDGEIYRTLEYDGSYVDSECSAFDDMFPTIDPYTPNEGTFSGITYPDHGEICRLPSEFLIEGEKVVFKLSSRLFPITYEKTVSIGADGGIALDYRIHNFSDEPFEFIYAGHIMLRGEDGAVLVTPFKDGARTEMIFATEGYPEHELPRDRLTGYKPGTGAAYKFYYTEPIEKGFFSLQYPSGRELRFEYDKRRLPYLGVWLNNGEFQNIYSISPEPCTAPFDAPDKARAKGFCSELSADEIFEFSISITVGQAKS